MVLCHYSPQACETINSPTDVVITHPNLYSAWLQYADCMIGHGYLQFICHDGTNHTVYPLQMQNGLWHYQHTAVQKPHPSQHTINEHINWLTKLPAYELWHQCLSHPNQCTICPPYIHRSMMSQNSKDTNCTNVHHACMEKWNGMWSPH